MNDTVLGAEAPEVNESEANVTVPHVEPEATPSIYGELEVKWPEGFSDDLKNEPSLKPFVKEDGQIDFSNLAKSYHSTKKEFGRPRAILPTENSTKEEIDEFYSKFNGYDPEYANYKLDVDTEASPLDEGFTETIRKFAHDNRLTPDSAKNLHSLLEEAAASDTEQSSVEYKQMMDGAMEELKGRWGQSYEPRVEGAKRLITDYLGDNEKLMEAFNSPEIGSNPLFIEVLGTISSKLYKEGEFHGKSDDLNMTPEDVELQIAAIMNDRGHAYHNPDKGAENKAAIATMTKLFETRAKYRK